MTVWEARREARWRELLGAIERHASACMDDAECAASCARATGDEEARMRLAAVAARAVADRESAATLSRVAHALEGR